MGSQRLGYNWVTITFTLCFLSSLLFFIKMTSTFNYFSYAFAYLPPLWRKLHEVSNHCLPLYPQYQRTIQWTLNIQSKCSGGGNVTRQVGRWVPQVTAVQVQQIQKEEQVNTLVIKQAQSLKRWPRVIHKPQSTTQLRRISSQCHITSAAHWQNL